MNKAYYHLPGLYEFYELYKVFLPLYRESREYFYDWCGIGSIYGAPAGALWGGGRTGMGEAATEDVISLMNEYDISPRLTFSNSLLENQHLSDRTCNDLCKKFEAESKAKAGVIVHSDLLKAYLKEKYPSLYLVSSTTKVLTDFKDFKTELEDPDFKYVVPDFRLNKSFDELDKLPMELKDKTEFLCNECCYIGCKDRSACYENVSRKNLGLPLNDFPCNAPEGYKGYSFSRAMENPSFIGISDILETYLKAGFSNFKIEGRGLGSAMILEFLLYYMTKPECRLKVREGIYLDSMLDLF